MFRRSSAGASASKAESPEAEQSPEAPANTRSAAQAGKGRPTPKRSEAERNRYRSIQGGTTSGRGAAAGAPARPRTPEEKARVKADQSRERDRRMQAMQRGEDWALPARDRGPVRKLARDYVDSHRRITEYFWYILILLIIGLFSKNSAIEGYISFIVYAVIIVVVLDGYFLARAIRKLAAERAPGQSPRGIAFYAEMRAMQPRRFRMPRARYKPGDKI
ncbi:MAG TPA: DUF3043 domain-containing protein [Trebonia sp.]|nr:DUF3043 domain-containing protein [Trebonia sp.]